MKKSLVIIGPTASGKSDLALQLAKERDGEIISVDSRQVYRGMDIGTGKITKEEMGGIPHHLIDICNPGEDYNVSDFIKDAKELETKIREREKTPIFCGGSLFWMESYLQKNPFPKVAPNKTLRHILEQKSLQELFTLLQHKDPERAKTIDPYNKVRLMRALEIIETLGAVPKTSFGSLSSIQKNYELIIIEPERETLRDNIKKRLDKRLADGMVDEVEELIASGISHEWLQKIGLEYRYISLYLTGKLSYEEMQEKLFFAIWHYAKRQITFLKRFKN
jgi:tRNA dimethylallyltransferase